MIKNKIISAITSISMALSCIPFSLSASAAESGQVLLRPESSVSNGASYVDPSLTDITYTFDEALAQCDAYAVIFSEISGNKSDDIIMIADYSKPDAKIPSNKGGSATVSLTDEVSFMGKGRTSLKWTITEAGSANDWFTTELVPVGFKSVVSTYPDSTVCIRYYSPVSAQGFGFTSAPKLDIRASQGAYTATAMLSGEWQTASVKASDLAASFAKWKNYAGSDIVVKFDAATGSSGLTNGTEIYIDRVWLDKNSVTEEVSDIPYSVSCSENTLKLEFDSSLDAGTYKVELLSDKIQSESGKTMKENQVFYFSVGCDSTYTVPVSVSPKDGSVDVNAREGGFKYSVEFNREVSGDAADRVVILKAGEIYTNYTLIAEDNTLTFEFGEPLEGDFTYTLCINPDFTDASGVSADTGYEFSFTTIEDLFSPNFKVMESTPANGAVTDSASEWKLRFNNSLDASLYYPDYISIYEDGTKLHSFYTATVDDKILTLSFNRETDAGKEYSLKISDSFTDMFGNFICDNEVLKFNTTTPAKEENCFIPLFSSDNADNMQTALADDYGWASETTALGGNHEKALRIDWKANEMHGVVINNKSVNIGGAKYVNYLVYSPEAYKESINLAIYKKPSGYGVYNYSLDYTGWRLITLPLSDMFGDSLPEAVTSVQIGFSGWGVTWKKDGYLGLEKIWLSDSKPVAPELISATYPDGYENARLNGECINLEFSTGLSDEKMPEISVTDENGNVYEDFECAVSDNIISLSFGALMPDTGYTVTIDNITSYQLITNEKPAVYTFRTLSSGIYTGSITFSPGSFGNETDYTATFKLGNLSDSAENVILWANAYDEDSRMVESASKSVSIDGKDVASESVILSLSSDAAYIKAYVMSESGSILGDEYTMLTSSGTQRIIPSETGGTSGISISSAGIDINLLSIKAAVNGLCTATVVQITAPDGSETVEPISAEESGELEYYYVFDETAPGGIYTLTITSRGRSASAQMYYISAADRNAIASAANEDSADTLTELLKNNKAFFGKNISDTMIVDAAEYCTANGAYSGYTDVVRFVENYLGIMNSINSAAWNTLADILTEHGEFLFVSKSAKSDFEYFISCKSGVQNTICKYIIEDLPVQTADELAVCLSDAIDKYKDSQKESTGGSLGSGSSGGTAKATSSSYSSADALNNSYTPVETEEIFIDLGAAAWARESILSLHKKGIVSSADDKKFRPNDNVTREEFVKLLVCAFAENTPGTSHQFTDAEPDAWYAPYLDKAYSAGIIKGYPDGSFGTGDNITREDMVTMCARTLELLGYGVRSDSVASFTDSADISDYAEGYVSYFAAAGIVNGMGDGTFAPKTTATRAQVAKIINELINLY